MKRLRQVVPVTAVSVAVAGVLLAATFAATPLRGQPGAKPDARLQVVENLDRLVQPRFQRLDLGFGAMTRLVRVGGHNAVSLRTDTPEEKRLLADVDAGRRDYVVAFLHCVHIPATAFRNAKGQTVTVRPSMGRPRGSPDLRYVAGKEPSAGKGGSYQVFGANRTKWQKATVKALPRLTKGRAASAEFGKWLLAMRPVKASAKTCLSCHTNSKQGDTLGVMVYAVR